MDNGELKMDNGKLRMGESLLGFAIEQVLGFQGQHFSKVPLHNIQGYDYSCKSQQTEW
jgi:hypothetical protein